MARTLSESSTSSQWPQPCRQVGFREIQLATKNFDESLVIGQGGFGKVYRGTIVNGSSPVVAAIKRLDSMSNQGAAEFWAEVEMLSKLRHCYLVSLIGYCNDGKEMILIYEYMPNGTLDDHLHKLNTPLSWLQRLKICIDAARGLDYLHTGTGIDHGVIHRDVKSSNVLLHESWAAKISDFGLSRIVPKNQPLTYVSTLVKGTFGYLDPDYFCTGRLTRKSDIYAFGVVLFEVLCRKRAVDKSLDEEQWGLVRWAQDSIKEDGLKHIIDSDMRGQISPKCLKEFARIAERCLHSHPKQRPTMAEVVVSLESVLALQEKANNSLHPAGRTIFGTMLHMFPFPSSGENPVGSKSETSAHIEKSETSAHIEKSSNQSQGIFTYTELASAIKDFKHTEYSPTELVTIYKGWVDERTYAPTECSIGLAINIRQKHIGTSKLDLRLEEFNHPNLVKLLGYCLHKRELFCVYEFIPNAGLDRHLFGEPGTSSLSWAARLKVAVGAAQGLSFLHQREHVAYGQFKTSVILLDRDLNARLSDFEVEKSFLVDDSYLFNIDAFYAAPEWFSYQVAKLDGFMEGSPSKDGSFGVKSEIYSFGVVLLEILTGQKVYDVNRPQGKQNLVKWATPLLADKEKLRMIMDPRLQHKNRLPKGAFEFALLVSNCLQPIEEKRPSMEEILTRLVPLLSTINHKSVTPKGQPR